MRMRCPMASSLLSSRRPEAFCLDAQWIVAELDEELRCTLHEGCGTANVTSRVRLGWEAHVGEHRLVDPPPIPGPALGLLRGERDNDAQVGIAARHRS